MRRVDPETARRLVRALPEPRPSAERVADVRDAILAEIEATPQRTRRAPWPMVALAAALLIAAGAGAMWFRQASLHDAAGVLRARVSSSGEATFTHEPANGERPERVRLADGRVDIEVGPGPKARPFAVLTDGARVEVLEARFSARARAGRLERVEVVAGQVDVRRDGRPDLTLGAGDTWAPSGALPAASTNASSINPVKARPGVRSVTEAGPRRAAHAAPPTAARTPPAEADARTRRSAQNARASSDAARATAPRRAGESAAEQAFREGWAALNADRPGEAAEAFARADRPGSPVTPEARYWRAIALIRAGGSNEGQLALERYVRRHPDGRRAGEAALWLARAAMERGDDSGARAWLERASGAKDAKIRERAQEALRALAP